VCTRGRVYQRMSGRRGDKKSGMAQPQDPRFAAAQTAPLFKTSKKAQHKIKLDDRFKPVLTDERFRAGGSAPIDKFGRKAKKGSEAAKKELEGFYQIEEDEAVAKPAKSSDASAKMSLEERLEYLNRLSRGEIADSSSEDSDDDEVDEEDEDDDEDDSDSEGEGTKKSKKYRNPFSVPEPAAQGEEEDEDGEGIPEGESSSRLAIQHCDWENLKAADLYVVLQSFCRPGQTVKRVTVYPSDFGLARMEHEARFGPEGIWKKTAAAADGDDEDDDEEDDEDEEDEEDDEDEDDDDDSDGVEADYDKVAGINDSDGDEEDEEDEDDEDNDGRRKKSAKPKKGDFRRQRGNVGVVLQDELVRRGKAVDDGEARGSSGSDKNNGNSGLDMTALREYELAKLRYYFAVAELDSVATAESLYQQLDGVELEHSSMAFDLRFVPDDVDLSQREVRDSNSGEVTLENYAPPDFIINALQHTEVKCTWEAGEGERERKLTNMSRWRDLAESDLQQFLASDDDDSEEDDGEGKGEGSSGASASRKAKAKHGEDNVAMARDKKKAAAAKAMRRALLGDDDEGPREEDEEDNEGDDFFTDDEPRRAGAPGQGGAGDEEDDTDKVFSYVPEASRQAIQQRKQLEGETPFEAKMRHLAEKKKARKDAKKAFKAAGGSAAATDDAPKAKGKGKGQIQGQGQDKPGKRAADEAELQLMFGDEEKEAAARDYDMRTLAKFEKNKELGKKSKRRRQGKGGDGDEFDAANDSFKVDLSDSRFQPLLEGDSRFGIDPVSVDFKATAGMKEILREQQQRRKKREREGSSAPSQGQGKGRAPEGSADETAALVSRLKKRLG